ncbi:MAG: hypothetical protein CMK09_16765 [Ponticaulis sp.]|nr:hypothetical protein [Ponticaulis sp.]|tara:strand:+ start:6879 stop:7367 length:489 start_codon:yes stop_codon:yes gene_type:complete
MFIRPYQTGDFDRLYDINYLSTPGVSDETREAFEGIVGLSICIVIGQETMPDGFINLIEPGTMAYKSPNLRWFEAWQAEQGGKLLYVDRIAFHPDARGQGLGRELYAYVTEYISGDYALGAEVNTLPNNPGSHRFHQSLGFEKVGEQAFSPEKAVAYYLRRP